jgi:nucleotide-binding universal stress UspA family protein
MKTFLVGMDESPDAARALRWAVEECRVHAAQLVVLHAWEWPYPRHLGAVADQALDELGVDGAAQRVLATLVAEALEGVDVDVPLEQRAIVGSPGKALIAASAHAELLVVGARGRGGLERLILGSVSERCAHHAHCPVLIMRPLRPAQGG